MKRTECRKCRTALLVAVVLLLVVCGMTLIFRVFVRNEEILLENEDSKLLSLAQSVDRSVVSYLGRYETNLAYITGQRGFLEAENTWLTTGESEDLLFRLQENLVAQYDMTKAVLVIWEREIVLSTDENTVYHFPEEGGMVGDVSIWPCHDEDENIYLAFLKENDCGAVYASLIDLSLFYQRVAGKLAAEAQERVMLLDASGEILLHRSSTGARADDVKALTEDSCDYFGLQLLQERRDQEQASTAFYEAGACITGEPYTARMVVVPAAAGSNLYFTIGVSSNYDQFSKPIHDGAIRLLIYGGMVVAGVLVSILLMLQGDRRNRQVLREIAALQEKNAAMETLNAKTRELAHHQRLETIGTLTSSIAHEFNNLLTPIMGYSILALEKLPPEEVELYDDLLEIYNSSRKAKDIISRLSDLSRKNTSLTYQYVAPDELAQRVLDVAAPARPPQVEVRTELTCRHVWLHGNETQLSQVLLNLVLNAFHAMERDGGTLTLSTAANENHIIFQVQDTGCGIAPEVLPHIFDPFFTTKETGKGTGLGLAIVQQVVAGHQGQIQVETTVGGGTTFTISFPLHTRQEN